MLSGQTNLSHLYFSRLSLAMTTKLNFFKTPTSVRLVQVGPCPLPLKYQAATSHTSRQLCRAKSLYMKRFWSDRSEGFVFLSQKHECIFWELFRILGIVSLQCAETRRDGHAHGETRRCTFANAETRRCTFANAETRRGEIAHAECSRCTLAHIETKKGTCICRD